ncbi:portal protein [Aurantiacibacter zhengii]|uniref:portal protein n=1 Tax=Aurantiacibacter zhengii TaxID=2307003 RepID=UPI00131498C4|nr:portal protein [Aurantiacibacter zhengii]
MIEQIQDEDLAKADLRKHEQLVSLRRNWEDTYQQIDERFPTGAGGFLAQTPGQIRGQRNTDSTHVTANARFAAALRAITTPEQTEYILPRFLDPELNKLRSVKLWRENAGKRLQAIRHAPHTGFGISAHEDFDQLGRYGTSAVWQEPYPDGSGIFYRTLHLSSVWIDVNFAGLVDTVHRKWMASASDLEEQFGREALSPKMIEALDHHDSDKADAKDFEILHVVCPNTDWDRERLDHRRFPIASRFLVTGEKIYLRRRGYNTMPISVSRHMTSAMEVYGRSPAINQLPNINGLNAMRTTTFRAAHKAVDPALLFNRDMGVTKLVTKPGGLNPGLMGEDGRPMVARMPGGENGLPIALEMIQDERSTIRVEFLEEFYSILTNPNSRMTTVEVYERMAKEGVLVRPYADRYATEKQHVMTQRDLDMALRAMPRQIPDFPPEVKEAGAWPVIDYENPLAAMARAESSGKTLRYVQALPVLADLDPNVRFRVDAEAIAVGLAEETGVPTKYIRSDEDVARLKGEEQAAQSAALDGELLKNIGSATKDFAQAGALQEGM